MSSIIEFTRGDGVTHSFSLPAASWSSGGRLFFTAKESIDDDNTDAAAKIDISFDDTVVSDITIDGVPYKEYTCYFPPSATDSIESNGALEAHYLGEFQYVPTDGVPMTFPAKGDKLDATVYFDVKRKTTV